MYIYVQEGWLLTEIILLGIYMSLKGEEIIPSSADIPDYNWQKENHSSPTQVNLFSAC